MAFPTAVNDQITDAATHRKPAQEAGTLATGNLLIAASHAAGVAMENAVSNQQNLNTLAISATAQCVRAMLELGPQTAPQAETEAALASAVHTPGTSTTAQTDPGPAVDANLAATLKAFSFGLALLDAISQQHHLQILQNTAAVAAFRTQFAEDPAAAFAILKDYCSHHGAPQQLAALLAVEDSLSDAPRKTDH